MDETNMRLIAQIAIHIQTKKYLDFCTITSCINLYSYPTLHKKEGKNKSHFIFIINNKDGMQISKIYLFIRDTKWCCGLMVKTLVLPLEDWEFDPRQRQIFFYEGAKKKYLLQSLRRRQEGHPASKRSAPLSRPNSTLKERDIAPWIKS